MITKKNLTNRTTILALTFAIFFIGGISISVIYPAGTLADDNKTSGESTEGDSIETFSSGDICCNWLLSDDGDLINANPSEKVGIGDWNVGETIDKTLEVRGDQRIDGMLSVSDNVFTESFLQSDKLAREETAPNLALINPDGEIIEVPLSPDIANWLFRLQDQDYFEDEGYDFGMGDDGDGDGDDDGDPLMDDFFFEFPYPGFYDPWCISGPLTWEQMGQSLLYADHCDEEAQVVVNRSDMWDDNTNFNVHGSSIFYDPDEDFMSTVNIRAANEETKAFTVQQHPWSSDEEMVIYGNGVIGARGIQVTDDSYTHDFPDYVFESSYDLKSMDEYSDFISTKGHLPGIPSAEKIMEQGYIDMGELQLSVLEKVEEQALYILELHEEKEKLENELKQLREFEKEIEELEERIQAIENEQ